MFRRPQFEALEPRALLAVASISGSVVVEDAAHAQPLSGVVVELLDESGRVASSAVTDGAGVFRFDNLTAGLYGLEQRQPEGYSSGRARLGGGGSQIAANLVVDIPLTAGQELVGYTFVEHPLGTDPANTTPSGDRPVFTTVVPPVGALPPVFVSAAADSAATVDRTIASPTPVFFANSSELLAAGGPRGATLMPGDDTGGSGQLLAGAPSPLRKPLRVPNADPFEGIWESLDALDTWRQWADVTTRAATSMLQEIDATEQDATAYERAWATHHLPNEALAEAIAAEADPTAHEAPAAAPTRIAERVR